MSSFRRSSSTRWLGIAACLIVGASTGCSNDEETQAIIGFVLSSTGGQANGQTGTGGTAGAIDADLDYGGSGAIQVFTTGSVDASFLPTATPPVDLGLNPLVVTMDTVIGLPAVGPPIGTPYAVSNLSNIYISDGNPTLGDEPPVTGLQVDPGATLTLPINNNGSLAATFVFTADIVIDGVLTVVDFNTAQRGSIRLTGLRHYMGDGDIRTFGTQAAQSGGSIAISVDGDAYNTGDFSSYGADNAAGNGGDGGDILIQTNAPALAGKLENMGQMDSHGGSATGSVGVGGAAGDITLIPYLALWNSGNLIAIGGDGAADGGNGGDILIAGYYRGELLNTGGLFSNGGDTQTGTGGAAGSIDLEAWGADLATSGEIQAFGGNGVQPNATGGDGGFIYFYVTDSDDTFEAAPLNVPAGDLMVTGNIQAPGGTAMGANGTGGMGGNIAFEIENLVDMGDQSIMAMGYGNINVRGANGYTAGTSNGIAFNVAATSGTPTGPITIQPTADTSGGYANPDLPGSTGGDGGDITLIGGPGAVSYNDLRANGGMGATQGLPGTISPLL